MTFILIMLILFFSLLAIKLLKTEHFQTDNENKNSLEKITNLLKNNDLVNQRKLFFMKKDNIFFEHQSYGKYFF